MPIDYIEFGNEPRKFRGRGNRGRGNFIGRGMKGPVLFEREKFLNKPMNGIVPMRRGMGRMHPYIDPRGRESMRGRPPGFMPPLPPSLPPREMEEPFSPPPPPLAPLRRVHPPPSPRPGLMGFRGMPPPPRGRGMLPAPQPRGNFSHSRGFPNGRGAAAHPPPPGRGQRWPAPPGGRRF